MCSSRDFLQRAFGSVLVLLRLISLSCISLNFNRAVQMFCATTSSGPVETSQKAPWHRGTVLICPWPLFWLLCNATDLHCQNQSQNRKTATIKNIYQPMSHLKATSIFYYNKSSLFPKQVTLYMQKSWSISAFASNPLFIICCIHRHALCY